MENNMLAVSTLTIVTYIAASNGEVLVIARSNLGKTASCVYDSAPALTDNHYFALLCLCRDRDYNGTFICGMLDKTYTA